ncbi:MAG: cyclic nucleotide-binding domain-containing protein [Proteobacteria bacterium]|nr:cyclic nucleotide-binding domain-containing protein [Pseudomonadota bacterium]MBU1650293.1 cyclic nucleotide-binding domain-containing protein [Pseudomonadota bacterium]
MSVLLNKLRAPGDLWGGLASMLVALPAAVAFGVTVYAAIGPHYVALGAVAGMLGAAALGLIAPVFGGSDRLISAPCAPAAAVLSAFAIELVKQGVAPESIVLLLTVLAGLTGLVQILFGFLGIGRIIKYIPYTVVSGYLSGVGIIIITSQIHSFMGVSADTSWWQVVVNPGLWDLRSIAVGAATVLVALLGPKLTKAIPGTILGICAGLLTYLGLAATDPSMMTLTDNTLVLGTLGAVEKGYFSTFVARWHDLGELKLSQIGALVGSALTLAALLSIDTLKTCVVIDQKTRTRHEPNRELCAQGLANITSSMIGGLPGSGTMGPSMVNLNSGAQTRVSGIMEGVMVLVAALALSTVIAWIPLATLAGILIVIGLRMIDTEPLRFLESRGTVLDFAVVLAVVTIALTVGLIAASASGVAMSILLFVREQVGGSVVRHKSFVNQRSSTWSRSEAERRMIEQKGEKAIIFELQGSLFFGTTYELYSTLEPEVKSRDYVILDLRLVQSVDITAVHMLIQVRDMLAERGAFLLLSNVHEQLPNGHNLREFFEQTGLTGGSGDTVHLFPILESAIEWVEERLIGEVKAPGDEEVLLRLQEMELFHGRKDETLADLEECLEERSFKAGETIYSIGDQGHAIYLIRRGEVRITAPIGGSRQLHHVATIGRGDFFGGLAFLDGRPRSDNAIAHTDTDLYILTLENFNQLAEEHKRLALVLISAISRTLAHRLRHANGERTLLHT